MQHHNELLTEETLLLQKRSGRNAVICLLDTSGLSGENLPFLLGGIINTLREQHKVIAIKQVIAFAHEVDVPKKVFEACHYQSVVCLDMGNNLSNIPAFFLKKNASQAAVMPLSGAAEELIFQRNHHYFQLDPNDMLIFAGAYPLVHAMQQAIKCLDTFYSTMFISSTEDVPAVHNYLLYKNIIADSIREQQERKANSLAAMSPSLQRSISSSHEPITPYKATLLSSKRAQIFLDWQNVAVSYANLSVYLAGIHRFCQSYGYAEPALYLHVYLDISKLPDIAQWFEKQPKTAVHHIDGNFAESADRRIIAQIQNEADFPINEALVLISGDCDFSPVLVKEAHKGRPVLLIYSTSKQVHQNNPLWLGAIEFKAFLDPAPRRQKSPLMFTNMANKAIKPDLCSFYQYNKCNYQYEDEKCSYSHVCERCIDYTDDDTQAHSSKDCFRPHKIGYGRIFSAPAALSQELDEIRLEQPQLHTLLLSCQEATQTTAHAPQESLVHYESRLRPLVTQLLAFSNITLPNSHVVFPDIKILIRRALAEPGNLYEHRELSGKIHHLFFLESACLFSNYGYCLEKQGNLQKAFLYFELAYFCCSKLSDSPYQKSYEISIRFHMIRNACLGLGKLDRPVQQALDQHHLLIADLMMNGNRAQELIFRSGIPDEEKALTSLYEYGIKQLISSMRKAVTKLDITRVKISPEITFKAVSSPLSAAPISSKPLMASSSSSALPTLYATGDNIQRRTLSEQDLNLIKTSGKNAVIYLLDTMLLTRQDLPLLLGEIIHTLRQEKQVITVSRIAVFNKENKLEKEFASEFINQNVIFLNLETPLTCVNLLHTANNSVPQFQHSQHFKLNPDDVVVFVGHITNIVQIQKQIKTPHSFSATASAFPYNTLFVANTGKEANDQNDQVEADFFYSDMIPKAQQRQQERDALVADKFNLHPSKRKHSLVQAAFNGEVDSVQQKLLMPHREIGSLISPLDAACLTKNKKITSLILEATQASLTPYQAAQLLSNEITIMIDWQGIQVTALDIPKFLAGLYQFCKSYGYPYQNVRIQTFLSVENLQEDTLAVFRVHGIDVKRICTDKSNSGYVPIMEAIKRLPDQDQALLIVSNNREFSNLLAHYAQMARPTFLIYNGVSTRSFQSNTLWSGAIDFIKLPALHQLNLKKISKPKTKQAIHKGGDPDLNYEGRNHKTKDCLSYQTKRCQKTAESCTFRHVCQRCTNLVGASEKHPETECFRPEQSSWLLLLPSKLFSPEPLMRDPSENNELYQKVIHYYRSKGNVSTEMILKAPLLYMLAIDEVIQFLLDLLKVNLPQDPLDLAGRMLRALGENQDIDINLDLSGSARQLILMECASVFTNYGCCLEQLGLEKEGFLYLELASVCLSKMSVKPEGMWASIRWNMLRNVSSELALQDRYFMEGFVGPGKGIYYHTQLIEGLQKLISLIETRERKLCSSLPAIKALQTSLQTSRSHLTPAPPPLLSSPFLEPTLLPESGSALPMSTYTENDVFHWLHRRSTIKSVLDFAHILRENRINGALLLSLTDLELQKLGGTAFTRNWIMRKRTTESELIPVASSASSALRIAPEITSVSSASVPSFFPPKSQTQEEQNNPNEVLAYSFSSLRSGVIINAKP